MCLLILICSFLLLVTKLECFYSKISLTQALLGFSRYRGAFLHLFLSSVLSLSGNRKEKCSLGEVVRKEFEIGLVCFRLSSLGLLIVLHRFTVV